MRGLQRAAVMLSLVEELKTSGSWCGETHIQKATYFLQGLMGVPLEYKFILYKHGPYSFDLREEVMSMLADDLFKVKLQPVPYGPSIIPDEGADQVKKRFQKTIAQYRQQIKAVAEKLGSKRVADLERLATALYVTQEDYKDSDVETRARRINELKPHVTVQEAIEAVCTIDEFGEQSQGISLSEDALT